MRNIFGVGDDYVRPQPTAGWWGDVLIALLLSVISIALVFVNREVDELVEYLPLWPSIAAITTAGLLLTIRRRFPITVMLLLTGVHFIVAGVLLPAVASFASMQIVYFLGVYTAMAFARRREVLAAAATIVYIAMAVWLALFDAYGRAFVPDSFQPSFWYYVSTILINVAYFGGAIFSAATRGCGPRSHRS